MWIILLSSLFYPADPRKQVENHTSNWASKYNATRCRCKRPSFAVVSDKFCGISNTAWPPHRYYCWPVVVDAGYPQEPPHLCLINIGTTQKFLKNFMGFYAIKVLLLVASILISISSVVAAAEPITIFGVNFDHSPDRPGKL